MLENAHYQGFLLEFGKIIQKIFPKKRLYRAVTIYICIVTARYKRFLLEMSGMKSINLGV